MQFLSSFVKLKFISSLFLWYNFTLISVVFTKYYLNVNGDSVTFTLATFAFGGVLKIFQFDKIGEIFSQVDVLRNYVYLAVCNIASLFLTNIAINQTSVSLIYVIKVSLKDINF